MHKLYERTLELVRTHRPHVEALATALLEKEVLSLHDLEEILGKRPFSTPELRNIDRYRGVAAGDGGAKAAEGGEAEAADKEEGGEKAAAAAAPPSSGEEGKKANLVG